MTRRVRDLESVRWAVRRTVEEKGDVGVVGHEGTIDQLVQLLGPYDRVWRSRPVVVRAAQLDLEYGRTPFVENIVLPPAKHNMVLLIKGLNYVREQRGLKPMKMPLFLTPDEAAQCLRDGLPCHCDVTRELAARRRTVRRLGRRGIRTLTKRSRRVFEGDEWKCRRCRTEEDLHIHEGPDGELMTLCRTCHVVEGTGSGELAPEAPTIHSQLAVVLQRGRVRWVGLVFGRDYVVLEA